MSFDPGPNYLLAQDSLPLRARVIGRGSVWGWGILEGMVFIPSSDVPKVVYQLTIGSQGTVKSKVNRLHYMFVSAH